MIVALYGCSPVFGPDWLPMILPDSPVNLEEFNSEYDDYNSDIPIRSQSMPFIFSSNRHSQGGEFDFVYMPMNVYTDRRDGIVIVSTDLRWHLDRMTGHENLRQALDTVNGGFNEFGPRFIPLGRGFIRDPDYREFQHYLFLFASDKSGSLDIYLTHNLNNESYTEPVGLQVVNTGDNEAYPSFPPDSSALYFCSDRAGNYDILKVVLTDTLDFLTNITTESSRPAEVVDILSSDSDDKCPHIFQDLMVFTSNRPGGYGGFDLYYSHFRDGAWTTPTNFGPGINSEKDEYRPIIVEFWDYQNWFMVFSSNRPGGKGGFDLYYVGISKDLAE